MRLRYPFEMERSNVRPKGYAALNCSAFIKPPVLREVTDVKKNWIYVEE